MLELEVLDEECPRIDVGRCDAARLPRPVDPGHQVQQVDAVARHLRHADPEPARSLEVEAGGFETDRRPVLAAGGRRTDVEEQPVADEPLVVVDPEAASVPGAKQELARVVDGVLHVVVEEACSRIDAFPGSSS